MKSSKTSFLLVLIFAGILYRLLISIQGLDRIDIGFSQTYYQNFFSHPDVMVYNHLYYLTGLVGALWNLLFGSWGLLGFRVLEALTIAGAVLLLALAYRQRLGGWWTTGAVLLSFLFPTIVSTFNYNTLTYLLVALALFLLQRPRGGLFLSGVALGLAVFARFVNLTLLALPLATALYGLRSCHTWRAGLRMGGQMLLGMICGSAVVLIVMAALGHLPHFVDSVTGAITQVGGTETTHTSSHLLKRYSKSLLDLLLQIAAVLFLWKVWRTWAYHLWVTILLAVLFVVLTLTSNPQLTLLAVALIPFLTLPSLLSSLDPKLPAPSTQLSFFLPVLAVCLLPLGSDMGMASVFHWMTGLLIFPAMSACNAYMVERDERQSVFFIMICIALCSLFHTARRSYGSSGSRLDDTVCVQPGRLNTLIDAERADRYRSIISAIGSHATEQQPLMYADQSSEIYYATGLVPYLGITQIGQFTGESLRRRLVSQEQQFDKLPLIVYPIQPVGDEDIDAIQADVRQWAATHGYTRCYADKYAEVWQCEP